MSAVNTLVSLEPRLDYDGTQLRPHFIRHHFGLKGDAAVVFRGACHVTGEHLVDLEDREAGLFIRSDDMLHVLVELFGWPLGQMVALQRLLAACVADAVRGSVPPARTPKVRRAGDDVFVDDGKLTVSIATVSAVSGLIHLGVNVDDRNTPVPTAALDPLGIQVDAFASHVLEALDGELAGMRGAASKVEPS